MMKDLQTNVSLKKETRWGRKIISCLILLLACSFSKTKNSDNQYFIRFYSFGNGFVLDQKKMYCAVVNIDNTTERKNYRVKSLDQAKLLALGKFIERNHVFEMDSVFTTPEYIFDGYILNCEIKNYNTGQHIKLALDNCYHPFFDSLLIYCAQLVPEKDQALLQTQDWRVPKMEDCIPKK